VILVFNGKMGKCVWRPQLYTSGRVINPLARENQSILLLFIPDHILLSLFIALHSPTRDWPHDDLRLTAKKNGKSAVST
jgi:hypothetical protein